MADTTSNDRVVLDALLAERQQERALGMASDEFFEVFVADEALREFRVSDAEVDFGLTGGGADGGLDAIYTFVDRELVMDVDDIPNSKDPAIDLVFIQSTTSARFTEDRVNRFHDSLNDLLELDADPKTLRKMYNESVIGASQLFAAAYLKYAGSFPTLRVTVVYASKGMVPVATSRLRTKARGIEKLVVDKFQGASVEFRFVGARGLVEGAHRKPALDFTLDIENSMNIGPTAYVVLIRLSEFNKLITQGETLRSDIFDANVRDYEGKVEVNRAIANSLDERGTVEDFWWLNNGVTVLSTKASLAGKKLSLRDPQIVNGFQTSTEISNYFRRHPGTDDRTILARIHVTTSEGVRDEIIRATNSQTAVGVFALRATDPFHRDLETYLRQKGLYYERRKNYHKNRGRQRARIVTVADSAQAMMAALLFFPDDSRARPSSLVKDDVAYGKVFNPEYPIEAFFKALSLLHQVRDYLAAKELQASSRNNYRFHMAMAVAASLGVKRGDAESLAQLDLESVNQKTLRAAFANVQKEFKSAMKSGQTEDQAAKSPKVTSRLVKRLGLS